MTPQRRHLLALSLATALALPAAAFADQFAFSSEAQSTWYPSEAPARAATGTDLRGWSSVEWRRAVAPGVDFRGDLTIYGSNRRRAVLDGEAAIVWRGTTLEVAAGLLREQWGRFANSALDALGPANTAFSLVGPERRLSQPTVRATAFLGGLSIDLYGLTGGRRQPVPESDGRFGFGVPSRDVAPRGSMGDQAVAARVTASKVDVDWSAHVFAGRSRRPAFVPRFTAAAELDGVDAVYSQVLQVGGELETTRADWRFLSEGFIRRGAVDVLGRRRTYGGLSAAAEYQRLGALDGSVQPDSPCRDHRRHQGQRRGHPVRFVGPRRHARGHGAPAARAARRRLLARLGPPRPWGHGLGREGARRGTDGEPRIPAHRRFGGPHPQCARHLEG